MLTGRPADANTNRLLKACELVEELPEHLARHAAELRNRARRGSAVDSMLVAAAEPGGTVLSGDVDDLTALATHADPVTIQRIEVQPNREQSRGDRRAKRTSPGGAVCRVNRFIRAAPTCQRLWAHIGPAESRRQLSPERSGPR
jgi:hypothetical protein